MGVPSEVAAAVNAVERDLDKRDPALDQATGEQAPLAERVAAVGVTQVARFFIQVERLDGI